MTAPLIIDTHAHLYRSSRALAQAKEDYAIWEYGDGGKPAYSRSLGAPEEFIAAMSACGVARAIVLNLFVAEWEIRHFELGLPTDLPAAERAQKVGAFKDGLFDALRDFNLWGCRIAKENPAITPFVSVDLNVASPPACVSLLRELVEDHGARGLKLHSPIHHHGMDDKRLWPVFEFCTDHGLPVLAHAGLDSDQAGYADPEAFARVLQSFPELRLVMAHMGGGAWRQTAAFAERFPNVWFDCAEIIEWSDAALAPSDTELAALIQEVGAHRVLMGSDYPWYDLDRTISRVSELPLLSSEEKELILGRNAERLLAGCEA